MDSCPLCVKKLFYDDYLVILDWQLQNNHQQRQSDLCYIIRGLFLITDNSLVQRCLDVTNTLVDHSKSNGFYDVGPR